MATLGTSDNYVAFTLKMFSSRSYASFSLHTQIESNRQGRVSLAALFDCFDSGILKTTEYT
jgi:hypothetical protein